MHKLIKPLVFASLAFALAGCHIAYTPDVQQGNLLDEKTVDQLKPGMTKRQVLVLMGTPSVASPFEHDRWDYVSTFAHRGGKPKIRTLTLTFNNDVLVSTEGDFFDKEETKLLQSSEKYESGYPTVETEGDKSKSDKELRKEQGSFGTDPGQNPNNH